MVRLFDRAFEDNGPVQMRFEQPLSKSLQVS
jgi:hypothetical protein